MYNDGTSGKFLISFDLPLVIYSIYIFWRRGVLLYSFVVLLMENCHIVM